MTLPTLRLKLQLDTNNAPKQLADVQAGVAGVWRAAAPLEVSASSAAQALGRVAHYSAAGLGLNVVSQLAQQAAGALFNASAAAERLGTQLAFASATPARDMAFLHDMTERLGLQFTSTAQAFSGFAAAAKGTSLEGSGARAVFESVAASASVMGLSADQASGAMLAIQQMMSKGVVSAEEFRGQLGERMPVALQAGARALEVTTAEFSKMLESGQIVASDFLPKFAAALDELLGDAAEKAAGRLDAAVNQMGNAWDRLKQKMGDAGISQALAGEARALGQVFDAAADNMQKAAERGGGAVQQWASGIGTVFGRALLGTISGASNVFNASINAVTGNVFALNESLSLLPDSLRTNAQLIALLPARLQEAQEQYRALELRLAQAPDNIYIKSELFQLEKYIAKLQETRELQTRVARDQEGGNSRGSQAKFERERELGVTESTKFVQEEQARASGQSKDYNEKLAKFQLALGRGVLSQSQYVEAVSRLADENFKLSDAQKKVLEQTTARLQQQAEFERAQRRLVDADLLASVRDRVARSVITQEQGISEVARIEREAALAHAREMDALANRTQDPVKRDKAVKDAALARQEALNIERQEQRELNALREKDLQTYHAQVSAAVMEDIKRRQSLEDSAHAMGLQTVQARESGVVIESVATILAREEAARYAVAAAMTEQSIAAALSRDASEEELAALRTHLDLLQNLAEQKSGVAKASGGADLRQAGLDQTKRLFGEQDPFAQFGQTLRDALGGGADGLARMVGAMGELNASAREYAREMELINKLRESGDKNNSKTADENELRLIKKKESAQINAYASMASAAKGYFGKQTAAYKILHGAEQALRTYQLVMSAQTMAKDLAAIGAKVSAWLAGDAAITSSAVASAGVQVTASSTEGAAAAAAGVANQAKGDPYSAFARMAAMAAMMAALGFAVSGSGRSSGITYDSFAAKKANDGTGTVFGDSKAQSQSIANSLQTLERIARPELQYTSQMLMHLRSIDQALGGATGLLLSRGLLSSDYQGASTGKKGFLGFSGSSSSSSVSSEGVNFGAQSVVQALMQGVLVDAYRIIRTDWSKSSWWGWSSSSGSYYSTSWGKVDGEATARFSKAVAEMRNTALAAADVLGRDTASKLVDALDTGLGKVEWKPDASLDDINRQIGAVFGQLGDRMAQAVLPTVTDFALGGEGYLETLTRLSAGLEEARAYAFRLGLGIGELAEMSNKAAKDVGAELVREAILKKETGNLAKLIETMSGGADDLAGAYTGLLDVRAALESLGFSAQSVSSNLLRGAGGMDGLQAGVRSFEENFLTPIERLSQQKSRTELEFSRLGQQLPASAQAFKEMVLAVDASTAAGQERLGKLLSLSDSYALLRDLQNEVDQAAKDAVKDSGQRIVDWLAKLGGSALGLASATERASTGRVQYGVQLALARAGDKTALESITTNAHDYLQAARDAAGNQLEYAIQLAQVKSDLAMLPAARTYIEQLTADQLRTMTETRDGILALKLLLADLKDLQLAQAATLAANTGKSASRTEDLWRMLERLEADGVFGGAA